MLTSCIFFNTSLAVNNKTCLVGAKAWQQLPNPMQKSVHITNTIPNTGWHSQTTFLSDSDLALATRLALPSLLTQIGFVTFFDLQP